MKYLIVGDYNHEFYENALVNGLKSIGINSVKYKIDNSCGLIRRHLDFYRLLLINLSFINFVVKNDKFSKTIFYRVNDIHFLSILLIKFRLGKIITIHNDRPYSSLRLFINNLYFFSICFFASYKLIYRISDKKFYDRLGYGKTILFPPHFCNSLHKNLIGNNFFTKKNKFVVFIGHFENDERIEYIDYLFKKKIPIKIYGNYLWKPIVKQMGWDKIFIEGHLNPKAYSKLLSSSWICLGFISKNNNDTYTRRFLEIPASGSILASKKISVPFWNFKDDENYIVYNSPNDLYKKLLKIKNNYDKLIYMTTLSYNDIAVDSNSEIGAANLINKL